MNVEKAEPHGGASLAPIHKWVGWILVALAMALSWGWIDSRGRRDACREVETPEGMTRKELAESLAADSEHADDMTDWAVLLIAGTIVSVLSTARFSPRRPLYRMVYLLFPIAWLFLVASTLDGRDVRGGYLAALSASERYWGQIGACANSAMVRQVEHFAAGAMVLGLWLMTFLHWWIFHAHVDQEEKVR